MDGNLSRSCFLQQVDRYRAHILDSQVLPEQGQETGK